jgi:hypothetical protein
VNFFLKESINGDRMFLENNKHVKKMLCTMIASLLFANALMAQTSQLLDESEALATKCQALFESGDKSANACVAEWLSAQERLHESLSIDVVPAVAVQTAQAPVTELEAPVSEQVSAAPVEVIDVSSWWSQFQHTAIAATVIVLSATAVLMSTKKIS